MDEGTSIVEDEGKTMSFQSMKIQVIEDPLVAQLLPGQHSLIIPHVKQQCLWLKTSKNLSTDQKMQKVNKDSTLQEVEESAKETAKLNI